jgi:Family of unknown function (DUF6152)
MKGGIAASAAVVGLLIALPVFAHHGSASYDNGKRVTLKGTVTEWVYSNPHCLLKVDVKGEDGKVVPWIAEGQAPNVIFPSGYRKDTFKPGDQVTLIVEPYKDGRSIGRILQTVLADGKTLGPASSGQAAAP